MTMHQQQAQQDKETLSGDGPRDRPQEGIERAGTKGRPRSDDTDRPLTEEEELDEALEETFPASDPIAPSHIDGPIKE